jgi:uncharacterized cupin superfamily protein
VPLKDRERDSATRLRDEPFGAGHGELARLCPYAGIPRELAGLDRPATPRRRQRGKIARVGRPNALNDVCEYFDTDPAGFRAGIARVGAAAGGKALAVKAYEIPSGENLCPYHYEYEEEWLVVLTGEVRMRTPEGESDLVAGDVVCFAPGPSGAHKVMNAALETARVLMFSSAHEPAVAVYPDSDKIGVWPGNADDNVMLRRSDGAVDYYDGER